MFLLPLILFRSSVEQDIGQPEAASVDLKSGKGYTMRWLVGVCVCVFQGPEVCERDGN